MPGLCPEKRSLHRPELCLSSVQGSQLQLTELLCAESQAETQVPCPLQHLLSGRYQI